MLHWGYNACHGLKIIAWCQIERYVNKLLNFSVAKKQPNKKHFFFVQDVFGMSSTNRTLHLTDELQRLSKANTHCP